MITPDGRDTAVDQLCEVARRRSDGQHQANAVGLGSKVSALAGLGAALALCSQLPIVRSLAEQAIAAGATEEEMLGVFMAVAPTIGTARVVANTPTLALALGYDIDAALESTETSTEH